MLGGGVGGEFWDGRLVSSLLEGRFDSDGIHYSTLNAMVALLVATCNHHEVQYTLYLKGI